MTSVIRAYDSKGNVATCDEKCYDAKDQECTCVCGGRNHGVGLKEAIFNTTRYAPQITQELRAHYPNRYYLQFSKQQCTSPKKPKHGLD